MNNSKIQLILFFCVVIFCAGCTKRIADHDAKTIKILSVVIVQQDGFLQYVLEPYLNRQNLTVEFSTGHHSAVASAADAQTIDIAITHIKVKELQALESKGKLSHRKLLFANPMAFIGPAGDPAHLTGMLNADKAVHKLFDNQHCFVINPHKRLRKIQFSLLPSNTKNLPECVMTNAKNTMDALAMSEQNNAYTLWGLHPFIAKTKGLSLQPVVVPDPILLENIAGWVIKDSKIKKEAEDLLNYLASDEAQQRLVQFRLKGHEHIQPWWPPK